MDYNSWIANLREVLQQTDSSLMLKNGHWEVSDRKALWDALGPRIFDAHLDRFRDLAVEVLTEIDPQFQLPSHERYAANIHGKVLKHSTDMRQGMAETLALLGNNGNNLPNCSFHKPKNTATLAIRKIFEQSTWHLWASLNLLLPTLAEAAPEEFLNSVENDLSQMPCPFDELFAQEDNGIFGQNYMTGLLWALEALAWDEDHLGQVALILAELASHDPGGNWANRPAKSLSRILLPWYPQTLASKNKRIASIKSIKIDFPEIAWKVLISLLPNQHQTTTGTYKPRWRQSVPEDWKPNVIQKEYWDQIAGYSEIAVEMAREDLDRLQELVSNLDNLPEPSFETILKYISSSAITDLPENQRLPIWENLSDFITKHRKFSSAKWALEPEVVREVEKTAEQIRPLSPIGFYRRLFSIRDSDLFDSKGNYKEQIQKLDQKRQQAIQEILNGGDLQGVIDFSKTVERPNQVGWALGKSANDDFDQILLPDYLCTENNVGQQFLGGYIWSRFQIGGWSWADELDRINWLPGQNCQLLINLPFENPTWKRAKDWLGEFENLYWEIVPVNPYQSESDLFLAIDKLLENGRPLDVIECLSSQIHKNQQLDTNQAIRALMDLASLPKSVSSMDSYSITEIIKALQNDPQTEESELFKVEWAYLPLLDRSTTNTEPKFLEKALATKPDFFCEVLRLVYRSQNEVVGEEQEIEESQKALATNAWRLLHEWRNPPGLQQDGSFSTQEFEDWLAEVKELCLNSGHLDIAMIKIGEVLFYCPKDPQGLWIDISVAKQLNDRDSENMRSGFRTEAFNSRGVHFVDPTGTPELELSQEWHRKAGELENVGFVRFAASLKELARSYEREAQKIIKKDGASLKSKPK